MPNETIIKDVLNVAERNHNFEVISQSITVFDAAEIFKNSYMKPPVNWYYDALVITANGKPDEQLEGIIVLKDIAEYITV